MPALRPSGTTSRVNGRAIAAPRRRPGRRRPPRRPGRAGRRGARRRPGRRHDHRGADLPCPTAAAQVADDDRLSVSEIYDRAAPGVVQITSTHGRRRQPERLSVRPAQREPEQALGSGFVIDKAGHIVTNYHVIEGADQIEVSFSNQDTLRATLVGSDPSTDIAVLRVEASSRGLTPLALGDSGAVRVGDPVVAIGNPFGLARTTTAGIVSAVQERTITAPNGYPIDHVIQTDAPINSGNSGGPLLNARGAGDRRQLADRAGAGPSGNVGIGFAVPSNTVKDVVAQLVATGKVDRAFLGIGGSTVTEELARVFRLPGRRGRPRRAVGDGTARRSAGSRRAHVTSSSPARATRSAAT